MSTSRAVPLALIGWLVCVELTSGVLQGWYVTLTPDIARHLDVTDADVNWFEAGQLLLSALVVPLLAKLGDMHGHKRMLLLSTALTAAASWWMAFAGDFWSYLVAFSLQGAYAVWLPLEVALIFDRGRRSGVAAATTRRAAGLLVIALEAGAIVGALGSAAALAAFGEAMPPTLMVPAAMVTLTFFAILWGVPESEPLPDRSLDAGGFVLLALSLLTITSGLTFLKLGGAGAWWGWAVMLVGVALLLPFGRWVLGKDDPAIDLRVMRQPSMWPVQLTAGLVGVSLLGAQTPLATYAGTDPSLGYGLGLDATGRSLLIGVYLLSLIAGAAALAALSSRIRPRLLLIAAAALVGIGYLLLVPFHLEIGQVFACMAIAGVGSGALVGALPAAAAAAAPRGQTGVATGMTNTTKTIGGSFASSIFAIVLAVGAIGTAASLGGYIAVWIICGVTALVAAASLIAVPRLAFADPEPAPEIAPAASTRDT
ncbi:MFS transporter [Agrococcus sp. HG114]|uniref:MFS transporter n=1 Tax=Agrococcus sp. HG114 TaxID=2969757 RepID=UPI00215AFFCC|nr:MFS transporter [Agrococcus sp. HG114]MCR8670309.1 MFS transporter [Agrococcus sp. HG114]